MKTKIYLLLITALCHFSVIAQTSVVSSGYNGPTEMLLNGTDLYIAEFNNGKISKIDITATLPTPTTVVSGLSSPYGLALKNNELYIGESGAKEL